MLARPAQYGSSSTSLCIHITVSTFAGVGGETEYRVPEGGAPWLTRRPARLVAATVALASGWLSLALPSCRRAPNTPRDPANHVARGVDQCTSTRAACPSQHPPACRQLCQLHHEPCFWLCKLCNTFPLTMRTTKPHAPVPLVCRNNGLLVLAESLVECLSGGSSDASARLAGQVPALQSWLDGVADVPQVSCAGCALRPTCSGGSSARHDMACFSFRTAHSARERDRIIETIATINAAFTLRTPPYAHGPVRTGLPCAEKAAQGMPCRRACSHSAGAASYKPPDSQPTAAPSPLCRRCCRMWTPRCCCAC